MKLKYYLRGMGIGIILTAIVMGFALGGRKATISDAEIIEMLKLISSRYSNYLAYSDEAGIRQVQFIKDVSSEELLNDYYEANI